MFEKGIYVLIFEIPSCEIEVGKLGKLKFEGKYAYIGSNQGGGRIKRHLKKGKIQKWHIDYLTNKSRIKHIATMPLTKDFEEKLAKLLVKKFEVIKNFGSSDCRDSGHLFKFVPELLNELKKFSKKEQTKITFHTIK